MSTWTLSDLATTCAVTERTVRYYITKGLLPPAHGHGRSAYYTDLHLARLTLVKEMIDDDVPLAKVDAYLQSIDDEEALALAATHHPHLGGASEEGGTGPRRVSESCNDGYSVASQRPDTDQPDALDYRSQATATPKLRPSRTTQTVSTIATDRKALRQVAHQTTTWDHIAISPDLEIHVRRPLTKSQNRDLKSLLDKARALFGA